MADTYHVKDHVVREVVNRLRDTALEFHAHGSLRERLARELEPLLVASRPAEVDDWISVEERLPTEYEPVLTFGAKRVGQAVMQFSVKDDWQIETASEWHCSYPPKYWKPLGPEPSHTTNKEK